MMSCAEIVFFIVNVKLFNWFGIRPVMGTEPDSERIGSGVRLHFSDSKPDPDLVWMV